jgi:O-antigen ligase
MNFPATVYADTRDFVGSKRVTSLAGVLAVMLAVAGGKWGAYLGVPPIFLADILIFLAIIHHFLSRSAHTEPTSSFRENHPGMLLLYLYLAWATSRFVAGMRIDLNALRDFAPFLYVAVGLLAASSLALSSQQTRNLTSQLLLWALGFHAAWVFMVSVVASDLPLKMPIMPGSQEFHFLGLRPDFDSAMVGVFSGWLILQIIRSNHTAWSAVALIACLSTFASDTLLLSRAGALGAITCLILTVFVTRHDARATRGRKAVFVLLLPIFLIVILVVAPFTAIGQRMIGTFGGSSSSIVQADAAGTTEARSQTWKFLTDYVTESAQRSVVGVGFGPNFMFESGASYLLIGSRGDTAADPRSPHNYWVTVMTRLGVPGLLLFAALMAAVMTKGRRLISSMPDEPLLFLAGLIVLSLLFPFTFGVILEAPFGAIPFFWSVGILLVWPVHAKRRQIPKQPLLLTNQISRDERNVIPQSYGT